jgi:signal transduction histidine kinase
MANRSGYELLNLQIGANTSMSAPEDERPKFRVLRDGVEIPAEELPIQRAAATGHSTFAAPLSVVFDDGTVRHVLCNAIPLFGPDGKPRGAVGATVDITDRKLAEDALASVSGRLIEAQEQERRRIARELHDDISQRLALMAIELQTLEKLSDDCPVQMHDLILHLYNRASGISTDVQSLSHELHSSKLEYLGIVTAMKSFCDEFAVQHEVKIDFDCSDVPGSLPENVSLCLFRVLQEGLRNAQKHSGERYFEVRLQSVSGVIQLTIRDSGTGFDSAEENMTNRGIGLISMRERVSLVNGTISILSRRMGGTEIIVRAPVSPSNGASPKKWAELGGRKGVCSDIAS